MSEHYTRNTSEATEWCNKCNAMTQHRIDGGRRGPCLKCLAKRERDSEFQRIKEGIEETEKREREQENPKLF
jgi:hypothetical protein